ncbi:MAG: biotin/lipoyl-binding protein, partial [Silvibacterium sp.]|nr:biotin/lipoyl-binding protein [Silvibacterium sp.]
MEQRSPDSPTLAQDQTPASQQDPPRKTKGRRLWIWAIVLLGFALVFYLVLRGKGNTAAQQGAPGAGRRGFGGAVTLTTATAKKGDIGVYLEAIGTVTPVFTTTIYNQVTGVVTNVYYREGQMVRKGDPLVEIDPRQYE